MSKRNSEKKNKNKKRKVVLTILSVFLIAILGVVFWAYSIFGSIKTKEISKNKVDLGINELPPEEANKDIINIALFGVDKRPGETVFRSDAIMVLTIDNLHNKIKMSSLMRDSYIETEKHGGIKLTEAYAYGGPEFAIKTINQTFNLNIEDYATVNFESMEDIVNELGGVEIDVTKEELPHLNAYANDQSVARNNHYVPLTAPGKHMLNGTQAVAYARIRYTASSDFGRTDRQRTVLAALVNKILASGTTKFPSIISKLAPYVETSMNSTQMLKIATSSFLSGTTSELVQQRFPTTQEVYPLNLDIGECIGFDKKITQQQIHDFIYNDIIPDGNQLNVDNNTNLFTEEEPKSTTPNNTNNTTNTNTQNKSNTTNNNSNGTTTNKPAH